MRWCDIKNTRGGPVTSGLFLKFLLIRRQKLVLNKYSRTLYAKPHHEKWAGTVAQFIRHIQPSMGPEMKPQCSSNKKRIQEEQVRDKEVVMI
jgi:hypothetical protein